MNLTFESYLEGEQESLLNTIVIRKILHEDLRVKNTSAQEERAISAAMHGLNVFVNSPNGSGGYPTFKVS